MNKKTAFLSAAIAGLMMVSGCASQSATSSTQAMKGECHGVNSCAGKGECGGKGHSCAGKNSCKGKGWVKSSEAACTESGGKYKG